MVWREEVAWMNRRVSYGCSQLWIVWGDAGGFGHCQFFFLFLILCSYDKARLLPTERDSLCLWMAICVFKILCRRIWLEIEKIKFVQILAHVWVDLDMAGEHLNIIRINNKNPENQINWESYYLSHFITLASGIMNFMLWGGFGQVSWGGYGHCQNPYPGVQLLPEKCPNHPWIFWPNAPNSMKIC